jgi:diguanylate cyclase (GGDEF)-like protein
MFVRGKTSTGLALGVVAVTYAAMFLALDPVAGSGVAALAVLPVIVAGWLMGFRGGMLAGFLSLPANTLLLNLTGVPGLDAVFREGGGAGVIALVVVGAGVGRLQDLSEKVEEQARELEHRASHDPLTDLPNRTLFVERLERALLRADPGNVAVLFLDLDDFKKMNDSLGHEMGDRLLMAAAGRIRGCLDVGDTVGRLGGDEFAVLLENIDNLEYTERVAQRILQRFGEPFDLDGRGASVTVSIGVALGSAPDDQPGALLNRADLAMYRAKERGKTRYEVSDR